MPDFEVFTSRPARGGMEPSVTVQRAGILSVNREAYELLGMPSAAELLFDHGARMMGFRAAQLTVPHAYRLRRQKASSSVLISGKSFLRHFGITANETRRYPATMIGDVLAVDLKEGGATTGQYTEEAAA
jgi:hypothetical protein